MNNLISVNTFLCTTGQFLVKNVVPQASGESAKVKVKVRVNIHGMFSVSSASLVEIIKVPEGEESTENDQTVNEEEVCTLTATHTHTFVFHLRQPVHTVSLATPRCCISQKCRHYGILISCLNKFQTSSRA